VTERIWDRSKSLWKKKIEKKIARC